MIAPKDVKIFKLKARGDPGAGKMQLLLAFGRIARSFGMLIALSNDGHDMLVTTTKAQRVRLYESNCSTARAEEGTPA